MKQQLSRVLLNSGETRIMRIEIGERTLGICGLIIILTLAVSGCAGLMDAKFVTKDGKESPYKVTPDKYEPPKDPTAPF